MRADHIIGDRLLSTYDWTHPTVLLERERGRVDVAKDVNGNWGGDCEMEVFLYSGIPPL